jgi:hypothetical protein
MIQAICDLCGDPIARGQIAVTYSILIPVSHATPASHFHYHPRCAKEVSPYIALRTSDTTRGA